FMFRKVTLAAAVGAAFAAPLPAIAADDAEVQKIRDEIKDLKEDYETRVRQLEQRLEQTEQHPAAAAAAPMQSAPMQSAPASPNAFNPAISLILGGQFSNLQRDPETYQIGGFIPGGDEVGPGSRSFNLGESELTVSASIDPYLSGYFVLWVISENVAEVEGAYVQTTGALPALSVNSGPLLP